MPATGGRAPERVFLQENTMKYLVEDTLGVFQDQIIELSVKALAIERMYGCSLNNVDPAHVLQMFSTVTIRVIP